jgi:hypothetical protein
MSDPTLPETPKERLARLKAESADVVRKRAERAELADVDAQIAAAERELKDEKAITQAECEHGAIGDMIAVLRTPRGVVIVKRPSPLVYRRFRDTGVHNSEELQKLIRPSLVHPSLTALEAILDELPALETAVADQVVALAGFGRAHVAGK